MNQEHEDKKVVSIAEAKGMTPEELIKKRGLPTENYRNNAFQTLMDDSSDGGDGQQRTISNADILRKNLRIAFLPEIDLTDPVAVQQRIEEYFMIEAEYRNKPTVAGLGLALNGMDRRRLYEIKTGNYANTRGKTAALPRSVTVLIKRAYRILEQNWEDFMQNGKINPVAGIFLGKNNYGYQDKVEHVVTPNVREGSDYSENEMRERYGLPPVAGEGASDFDGDKA